MNIADSADKGEKFLDSKVHCDEPEEIGLSLQPVEPLNLEILPDILRERVQDVSERLSAPPDFIAAPLIVMLSQVIGTACGIKPKQHDDWIVISNIWGGIIGNPSVKKSPCIGAAFEPLALLEEKAEQDYEDARKDQHVSKTMHELRITDAKRAITNALKSNDPDKSTLIDQQERELRDLQDDEPEALYKRRFRTNDCTIEKLGELLHENPRGLLVVRDELVGLLTSWEKLGRETDKSFYLECWNGNGSFNVDRIGRPSIRIDKACASLFGGIQPAILVDYLEAMTSYKNDGCIQRFQLLVYPDIPAKFKYIDRAPNKEAYESICNIVETLADSDFTEFGAIKDNDEGTAYFHFDKEAQGHWDTWYKDHNDKQRADDDDIMQQHLGKFDSLVAKLALIFHLVDCVANNTQGLVSLNALERAIRFSKYLESHARRIYSLAANLNQQRAILLSKKLQKRKLNNGFTIREVYRKGWRLLKNKKSAEQAIEYLEDANWLSKGEVIVHKTGGPPMQTYRINPKIYETSKVSTDKTDKCSTEDMSYMINRGCSGTSVTYTQLDAHLSPEDKKEITDKKMLLPTLKAVARDLESRGT